MQIIHKSQLIFLCCDKIADGASFGLREWGAAAEGLPIALLVIGMVADAPLEIVVSIKINSRLLRLTLIRLNIHIFSLIWQLASFEVLVFDEGDAVDVDGGDHIILILYEHINIFLASPDEAAVEELEQTEEDDISSYMLPRMMLSCEENRRLIPIMLAQFILNLLLQICLRKFGEFLVEIRQLMLGNHIADFGHLFLDDEFSSVEGDEHYIPILV